AEDGIRDFHVTGVQTCALPIWLNVMISTVGTRPTPGLIDLSSFCAMMPRMLKAIALRIALCISSGNKSRIRPMVLGELDAWIVRSEERRVGKGGRCRWAR